MRAYDAERSRGDGLGRDVDTFLVGLLAISATALIVAVAVGGLVFRSASRRGVEMPFALLYGGAAALVTYLALEIPLLLWWVLFGPP